jgi:hypothetical protein
LEWYDPAAIITKGGALVITLSEQDPEFNHNMSYRGGMMATWNNFCFTGGGQSRSFGICSITQYNRTVPFNLNPAFYASVNLPGSSNALGYVSSLYSRSIWSYLNVVFGQVSDENFIDEDLVCEHGLAVWAVGNLGRVGYGASLEGMASFFLNSLWSGLLIRHYSGRTPTIPVMSVQLKTNHSTVSLKLLQRVVLAAVHFLSYLVSVYQGALAKANRTQDPFTRMVLTSVALPLRSMSSKPRHVAHTSNGPVNWLFYQVQNGVGFVSQTLQLAVSWLA